MHKKLLCCLVAAASCGGGASGSKFPDGPDLVKAQAEWCQMLGKVEAGGAAWEHDSSCKSATPTSSPAYLRGMTKCFATRIESAGDSAPDRGALTAECNEEVVIKLSADGALASDVIAARCERMEKCEKVAPSDCKTGVDKLETAQKVMLTTTYNAPALDEIADCLRSKSCGDDEEKVRDACYEEQANDLLWFPQ
jgi:hypothetical protein